VLPKGFVAIGGKPCSGGGGGDLSLRTLALLKNFSIRIIHLNYITRNIIYVYEVTIISL
jgi:hypothetical protein